MIHFPGGLMGKAMRDVDETSRSLFNYVDIEERISARHPLHKIRQVVNDALFSLDADFAALYVDFGRPSIASERLIRACLLQILFSVRSERQMIEQMRYNLHLPVVRRTDHAAGHKTSGRSVHLDDGSQQPRPTAAVAGRMRSRGKIGRRSEGP